MNKFIVLLLIMLLGNVINADSMYSNFSGSQRVVTVETSSSYTPTTSPYSPPASPPAPTYGKSLGVNVLDSRTVVLSSDYNYAYVQQFYIDFSTDLIAWDLGDENDRKLRYNHSFRWYYAPYIVQDKYHFTHSTYWNGLVDLTTSTSVEIVSINYHASDNDLIHLYGVISGDALPMVMNPDIRFYNYITVSPNLIDGHTYTFTNTENITTTLNWDEDLSISRLIKVNQIGYRTTSNAKFAYLGACIFNGTPQYDVDLYIGTTFNIVSSPSGTVIYTGQWALNSRDYRVSPIVQSTQGWAHGEDTLEGDFSAVCTPGYYYVQQDGIGCSFQFVITDNPYVIPVIHVLRSLFYQTNIAAEVPYVPTAFIHEKPILVCKKGQFVAEGGNYGYNYSDGYGLVYDSTGLNVAAAYWNEEKEIQSWQNSCVLLGRSCPTINTFWGGWKDANDSDQRKAHLGTIADLITAQTLKPRYCPDGALHIPSSNNGIDDDIDQINYGLRNWAYSQDAFGTGGVGLWINRVSSGTSYYASHPTLLDSMVIATYFAKYALCVSSIYPTSSIVTEYSTRALNAYNYAINSANRYISPTFNLSIGGVQTVVKYVEAPLGHIKSWSHTDVFLASAYLYELAKKGYVPSESYFLTTALSHQDYVNSTTYGTPTFVDYEGGGTFWIDLYKTNDFPTFNSRYRYKINFCEDVWSANYLTEAYHRPMYSKTSSIWDLWTWGGGTPGRKSSVLIALDYIDRLDGETNTHSIHIVEHCANIALGANEQGESDIYGIGYAYPMSMRLNYKNYSGYAQPIPGYVRYDNTGSIAGDSIDMEFGLFHDEEDHWGQDYNIAISLLDPQFETATINAIGNFNITDEEYKIKRGLSTGYNYGVADLAYPISPIFRRDFINIDDIGVNEFTINETLSPTIVMLVSLLNGALPVLPTADIVYTPESSRTNLPYCNHRIP